MIHNTWFDTLQQTFFLNAFNFLNSCFNDVRLDIIEYLAKKNIEWGHI